MLCDLGQVPSLGLRFSVRLWGFNEINYIKLLAYRMFSVNGSFDITCLDWTCHSSSPRCIPIPLSRAFVLHPPQLCVTWEFEADVLPRASWSSSLWKYTNTLWFLLKGLQCRMFHLWAIYEEKSIFDIIVDGKIMRKPLSLILVWSWRYSQQSITETPSCLQSQLHSQSFFLSFYSASPAF